MEALEQYIYPPLARIVGEYNPPEALLVLSLLPNYKRGSDPLPVQSLIVDLRWARALQKYQRQYPNEYVVFTLYDSLYDVPINQFTIKVIENPALIEAFTEIYDENPPTSINMNQWLIDSLKYRHHKLENPEDEEDYDPDEDPITVDELSNYFLTHEIS